MAIRTLVTRGFGNGTFNGTIATVVLRGYASGVAAVVAGGKYNAGAWFTSGQADVTITLYNPEAIGATAIALDDNSCTEVGSTGLYLWDFSKITTLPSPYKEYCFVMTDGVTSEGGILAYDEFFAQYLVHQQMIG